MHTSLRIVIDDLQGAQTIALLEAHRQVLSSTRPPALMRMPWLWCRHRARTATTTTVYT